MSFLKPKFVLEWRRLLKEDGFKGFVKKKGWKIVAAFFIFYFVRDSILYIIIPYMIYNNLIQCS